MLELYVTPTCPFCIKVLKAAEQMGLDEGEDYQLVDASPGSQGRLTVRNTGGKEMVPFLIDGTVSMYESDDIIAYLKSHLR